MLTFFIATKSTAEAGRIGLSRELGISPLGIRLQETASKKISPYSLLNF